ncbi:MAG: fasciclin domain-containing protein [Planctomycetota bacterium]|nr:MAG: fasciclin domain-containing protein [Planctomycetota bacterium]
MKTMLAAAATLSTATVSYAQCSSGEKAAKNQRDIVETAVEAGQFNTLVAAVKAAGLVDVLKGDGPFTVFAPTDDAFAKLPKETLSSLLEPGNKDKLAAILTYHVVPGELVASNVMSSTGAVSVNGQWLGFRAADGKVMVDEATVIKADIACKNGVIHVIDRVVTPEQQNLVQVASKAESFKTLLTAATKAGLADVLQSDGPFTVFAPTDEAFAKLPPGTLENLLKPENKQTLAKIIKYHVIPGRVYSPAAMKAKNARTLAEQDVRFTRKQNALFIDDARIVATDIDASNGVIHVIDKVILPNN